MRCIGVLAEIAFSVPVPVVPVSEFPFSELPIPVLPVSEFPFSELPIPVLPVSSFRYFSRLSTCSYLNPTLNEKGLKSSEYSAKTAA